MRSEIATAHASVAPSATPGLAPVLLAPPAVSVPASADETAQLRSSSSREELAAKEAALVQRLAEAGVPCRSALPAHATLTLEQLKALGCPYGGCRPASP